jgi:hypothetical protein
MNRRVPLAIAIGALIVVAAVLAWPRGSRLPTLPSSSDTTGFRTSDVALLGSTGTPQLVEFFHPD